MLPGDTVEGRYALIAEVGTGGMGEVFRARDIASGAEVALKLMRRDRELDIERFHREVAVLATLAHPNIVRYLGHGTTGDGTPFLVQEWIEGETLGHRLSGAGLSPDEAIAVVRQVAAALGVAHRLGVVHRDVKPDNILLVGGSPSDVRLIDFGIARRADEQVTLTRTGSYVGTPGYMSPEQARGVGAIGPESDVFSLGCVFYECLTGCLAFVGSTATVVRTKVILVDPPALADALDLPDSIYRLVDRMLAKGPARRPPDGDAVAAALDAIAVVGPIGGDPRGRAEGHGRAVVHLPALSHSATSVSDAGHDTGELTSVDGPWSIECLVLVWTRDTVLPGGAANDADDHEATRFANAAAAAVREGGQLDTVGDGVLIVTVSRALPPGEQTRRAARCALALRAVYSRAPIVLAGGGAPDDLGGLVERGLRAIEIVGMRQLFGHGAGPPGGARGIHVADGLVGWLAEHYELVRDEQGDGGYLLLGPRLAADHEQRP